MCAQSHVGRSRYWLCCKSKLEEKLKLLICQSWKECHRPPEGGKECHRPPGGGGAPAYIPLDFTILGCLIVSFCFNNGHNLWENSTSQNWNLNSERPVQNSSLSLDFWWCELRMELRNGNIPLPGSCKEAQKCQNTVPENFFSCSVLQGVPSSLLAAAQMQWA